MKNTASNRAYARKTLAYIKAHPEQHDQAYFVMGSNPGHCGTTMCIAGTAAYLKHGPALRGVLSYEGEGQKLLGLSDGETQVLFYEMNEARAVAKLEKVVKGESFTKDDYYRAGDSDWAPEFDEAAWEQRDDYSFDWN